MGDRASVSFAKNGRESVTLFSHLGRKRSGGMPLDRLDPETVIVDFIRHMTHHMDRVESNYYLGRTADDGDNSNNGHKVIAL